MDTSKYPKVPNLTTTRTGPLEQLEQDLLNAQVGIESWLREQWQITPPPFYCSVDLRNAGFKLAPVDTNLFPAGFNNLNHDFMPMCIQAAESTIMQLCPSVKKIVIVPESHTRNMFYFENLSVLVEILTKAGFDVRIGSLIPDLSKEKSIDLPSGREIQLWPLQRYDDKVGTENFVADMVLINNDMASGVPDILLNLDQLVMPPTALGWSTRFKSSHFQYFANVAHEFSREFNLDPWTIAPLFEHCGEINFKTREGEDCLVRHATKLLKAIRMKYDEYNISHEPFLVLKSDAGTYGMAVMMIKDPEELRNLNRKQREKMTAGKGGQSVTRVIIQEGVHTFETWNDSVAEPVVYMIGRHVIGGFYRVHSARGVDENLNAPGMNFEPLAFAEVCNNPCGIGDERVNRFYSYGVIARLALVAAARESEAMVGK